MSHFAHQIQIPGLPSSDSLYTSSGGFYPRPVFTQPFLTFCLSPLSDPLSSNVLYYT